MEAGFLNHSITPHNGLLIKKTNVDRKLEIPIPKFVWNSDNPDSNLKNLNLHSASPLIANTQIQKFKRKNNLLKTIKTKIREKKRKEKKIKIQEPPATQIYLFESPRAAFLQ